MPSAAVDPKTNRLIVPRRQRATTKTTSDEAPGTATFAICIPTRSPEADRSTTTIPARKHLV
jgi:hypothetical protein